MNNKFRVGRRVSSLERYADVGPITAVALLLDDGNEIVAGDTLGYTFEIECPYGTQAMADNLLASLSGKIYKPFRATAAELDPAAELGDGIYVDGEYSFLAYQNITCGPGHMSEIAAPGESYSEHEYGYKTSSQRQTNRKIAQTNSKISKTSEEIMLEVNKKTDEDDVNTLIKAAIDEIELSVSSSKGSTTLKLTSGSVEISSKTLDITVDAVNISGQLTADKIDASELWVDAAHIYGELVANKMYGSSIGLTVSYFDPYTYETTVETVGSLELAYTSTGTGIDIKTNQGGMKLTSAGNIWMSANNGDQTLGMAYSDDKSYSYISAGTHFIPGYGAMLDLGYGGYVWRNIYASTGSISTSDANRKHDIEDLPDKYIAMMDMLMPKRFKLNDGTSDRYHPGFIAQDVKAAMDANGVDSSEFGGWVKSVDADGDEIQMLRYEEFIAIQWAKIRQLEKRIAALEV